MYLPPASIYSPENISGALAGYIEAGGKHEQDSG